MSDQNLLSLNCSSEHCNFRTPLLEREQYQAMVAHLQVHSALAHEVVLPPNPGATSNANLRERCVCNAAGHFTGFEDDHASSVRSRSRSRSRRRDRTFRCTDCSEDRAYETERGLKCHKQRYCGKPREEGVFPCTVCDKVSVTAGLLKMHMGRFHTDQPILGEERGSGEQGNNNNVNNKSKEDAPISSRRGESPAKERNSSVGADHGGTLENREGGEPRRDSASRSSSSSGNCAVQGNEMSAARKGDCGLGMRTSLGHQASGGALGPSLGLGAGTSSSGRGRSVSPSEWSDLSTVSSTAEGRKSLVKVDMVVQNCLTRITYRVSSTAPIAIILPKVAAKLGTGPENVVLRMANVGNGAEGDAPRRLPRDRGLLVDVADNAEDFATRVIYATLVA